METVKIEHDSDSESCSLSSQKEKNISDTQNDEVPVLLVAEVRQSFIIIEQMSP
jgi:hypothetical protein